MELFVNPIPVLESISLADEVLSWLVFSGQSRGRHCESGADKHPEPATVELARSHLRRARNFRGFGLPTGRTGLHENILLNLVNTMVLDDVCGGKVLHIVDVFLSTNSFWRHG